MFTANWKGNRETAVRVSFYWMEHKRPGELVVDVPRITVYFRKRAHRRVLLGEKAEFLPYFPLVGQLDRIGSELQPTVLTQRQRQDKLTKTAFIWGSNVGTSPGSDGIITTATPKANHFIGSPRGEKLLSFWFFFWLLGAEQRRRTLLPPHLTLTVTLVTPTGISRQRAEMRC